MRCNPLTWKLKTFSYITLSILGIYMLFIYKKSYQVIVDVTIKNTTPEHVWEFVADFSNMKKLNPTIEQFDIIHESGNLDHWQYSVYYTEHLSQFPSIKNYAYANYSVKPVGEDFVIMSQHKTCFYGDYNCVHSHSEFKFSKAATDTRCVEEVNYECPITFSTFCYKEVMFQRREIMDRLKKHFSAVK